MVFAPKQLTSKLVDKQYLGQINMLSTKVSTHDVEYKMILCQ
jgi:hypothetical protein